MKDPMRENIRNEISFFDQILNEVEQDFMTGISKFSFRNQTNYFFRLFSNYVRTLLIPKINSSPQ